MGKKVLIIARDFIPYVPSIGGSMRILKLAEYLNSNNYNVYIMAAKGKFIDYYGYQSNLKKFNCIYIPDVLQSYLNKMQKDNSRVQNVRGNFSSIITKFLKNTIKEISIPDLGVWMNYKYFTKAKTLIEKHQIKNVIISSPPHSMQLVGVWLKKKFSQKINFIVDYRDSWNNTSIFKKNNFISQRINEHKEKKVLKYADNITYISEPIIEKINKFYQNNKILDKSILIMNGYDRNMEIKNCEDENNSHIKIGYFGSISDKSFRDPTNFLNSLKELINSNPKYRSLFKIIFYGKIDLNKKIREELNDILEIRQGVDHKKALEFMSEMDYLLIIHSKKDGADEVITGKFFDYLFVQKPILVVGPKNMEAARLVKKENIGLVMDINNKKDIKNKIKSILNKKIDKRKFYKDINIKKYSRQNQYTKFLKILK